MQVSTTEFLISDDLAGGCLDERRASKEDSALILDDDDLVGHRWHVGSSSRA